MRGHFKFVRSSDIKYIENGSILLSSLDWFRHLEARTKSRWIGDRMEGAGLYTGEATLDELPTKRVEQLGIKFADESMLKNVAVSNVTLSFPFCLVYCFATGDYRVLRDGLCTNPEITANERYDASVWIKDTELLLAIIFHEGRIQNMNNAYVRDHFHGPLHDWGPRFGAVNYSRRDIDIRGSENLTISPFEKGEDFCSQSETRIVLIPKDRRRMKDRINVVIPNPNRVFETYERKMEDGQLPVSGGSRELASELEELARHIDHYWVTSTTTGQNLW